MISVNARLEKRLLLLAMHDEALLMLRDNPVVTVIAFEEHLRKKFPKQTGRISGKIRSGRVEWKNLVDWVKARLTMHGKISYFGQGDDRYIVFMEPCGEIEGKSLTYSVGAWRAIGALARFLS